MLFFLDTDSWRGGNLFWRGFNLRGARHEHSQKHATSLQTFLFCALLDRGDRRGVPFGVRITFGARIEFESRALSLASIAAPRCINASLRLCCARNSASISSIVVVKNELVLLSPDLRKCTSSIVFAFRCENFIPPG